MPGVIDWMIRSKALFCFSRSSMSGPSRPGPAAKANRFRTALWDIRDSQHRQSREHREFINQRRRLLFTGTSPSLCRISISSHFTSMLRPPHVPPSDD